MGHNFISRIRILHWLESCWFNAILTYFTEAAQLSSGCSLNNRRGVRDVSLPKNHDHIRKTHLALVGYRHHTVKTGLQPPLRSKYSTNMRWILTHSHPFLKVLLVKYALPAKKRTTIPCFTRCFQAGSRTFSGSALALAFIGFSVCLRKTWADL